MYLAVINKTAKEGILLVMIYKIQENTNGNMPIERLLGCFCALFVGSYS